MVEVDFDYNADDDALYLYDSARKSSYSVEFSSEVIADIDARGNISGLEVLDASKEFDVSKDSLKEIKSAKLSSLSKKGVIVGASFILILAANEVIKSKLLVPAVSSK